MQVVLPCHAHGVMPGEAGTAVLLMAHLGNPHHALMTEIGKAIGLDKLTDFLHRMARGDQLFMRRRIDTV